MTLAQSQIHIVECMNMENKEFHSEGFVLLF